MSIQEKPPIPTFRRAIFETVVSRIREPRRFIQVLAGPRQVGKTTLALQVVAHLGLPAHYASADEPTVRDRAWIAAQWEVGRQEARKGRQGALLVLDETQKVTGWSETFKRLWDEDSRQGTGLRVILLGSSPLLIQKGLTESLAGRFEILRVPHWSFAEMRDAFAWDLDRYLFFGGYPGAAPLVEDERRWANYILDSLIETTLSRDILVLTRVDKPALLRQLFQLGTEYSAQVLSYTKMLGQLQDAGNATTLAHYLKLLEGAGLLMGLQKYSGSAVRQRGSSPKLLAMNTALITALAGRASEETHRNPDLWGRLVESAVGAHLVNGLTGAGVQVLYWREGNREVDYVIRRGTAVAAIEVASGRRKDRLSGMEALARSYDVRRMLLVGAQGISLLDFFSIPPEQWIA